MSRSKKGCNRDSKKKKIDGNKDVDPQLWHAFAGTMVQIPQVNSIIFYFPQGHAEHAYQPVHFPADFKIPSKIPCRVATISYRADPDTDEVYAKLRLVPLNNSEVIGVIDDMSETKNKYQSYIKTLTQSDASCGCNRFTCPRYCAETLFPPLDYSDTPPSQNIYPTDVHGETWVFKHVYRGAPKRHLFATGWKEFVTEKLLVPGDSLVFLRAQNSDLHIGIRRSKRGNDFGLNPSSKSKPGNESYGEHTSSSGEKDDKPQKNNKENDLRISGKVMGIGKVRAEDVIEAVKLGVNMEPFDVVYYPRFGTPEFFVKTSLIRTALQTQWYCGMRFKMAIETEDLSKIIWFYGTVTSFLAANPAWPDSLWRLLQVTWDEPDDLLTNAKRLNPWQVEILQYMPPQVPFSPFLPLNKELRFPELPTFPKDGQFRMPSFPNHFQTPNLPILYSTTRMQGASNDSCSPFKPCFQQPFNHDDATSSKTVPNNPALQMASTSENVSCSAQPSEKLDHAKLEEFVPLGQTIQIDSGNQNAEKIITNYSSDPLQDLPKGSSGEKLECNPDNQCKKDASAGETVEIEHSVTSSKEAA